MTVSAAELSRWEQQNVALAAVAQCADAVRRLALDGSAPDDDMAVCVDALLVLDPKNMDAVFPDLRGIRSGLLALAAIFGDARIQKNADVLRYTLGMLTLRKRLDADPAMGRLMRNRLRGMAPFERPADRDGDPERAERLFERVALLYMETISTLSYRIQVQGRAGALKSDRIVNRIRTMLLAGIRAAVLWHQLGGRRWRLLVHRRRVGETARDLRRRLAAGA